MNKPRKGDLRVTKDDAGPPLSPLPRAPRQLAAGWRAVLPIVILLYLCVASIHAYRTPVGATGYQDAPDEEAHVIAARVLATGRMPTRQMPGTSEADRAVAYEWHQPPLYYFLAARLAPFGVRGMRLLSIVIGLACILAVYRAARILLPEQPETAVVAAGISALTPGHTAITSVVNNDGLLELCFTGYLLVLFASLAGGLTVRRIVLLGVILGSALLTKVTALVLLPLTFLGLALLWRNGEAKRTVVGAMAAISGIGALISGWWFVRNGILYHEPLPLTAFRESFEGTVKAADIARDAGWGPYAILVATWTFESFFAVYSTTWGALKGAPSFLAGQLYALAAAVVCAAAAGLGILAARRRNEFTRAQICGCLMLCGLLGLVAATFALFTSRYFQAQGRYFYPAMLPITVLSALGWRALFPERYRTIACALLLAFLGLFNLAFLQATA